MYIYNALTYDVMKYYLTRVRQEKFVTAISYWKQGVLYNKENIP